MNQADRDRLVALKKAKKKQITQREAAEELGLSVRQIKRLLKAMKKQVDRAVIHGQMEKRSNNRIEDEVRDKALRILRSDVYRGFGPTWLVSTWARSMGSPRAGRRSGNGCERPGCDGRKSSV